MNIEELRDYCLAKKGTTEGFPFDDVTLVFKVIGKVFALTSLEREASVNLKCDPERAIELREQYDAIKPGFHMNKKHWNTVMLDENLNVELIKELIDNSYDLVASGLTKAQKQELTQ